VYLLYTAALGIGLLLTLPYYIVRFRKYLPTIPERMGFVDSEPADNTVWLHAVSVGEVKAIDPLISGMRRAFPDRRIVVSTTTPTGRALAQGRPAIDRVIYFPIDLPGTVRRALDRIRPGIVVVAETEIWPNFLRECGRRGVPVFMVNGRISDRSYGRYRVVARWLGRVLDHYRLLGMQSEADAGRMRRLGAPDDRVLVLGNVKYDRPEIPALDPTLAAALRRWQPLVVAASTAAGEEPLVIDAFRRLREGHPAARLLIAPRLADRFDEVERLSRSSGFRVARRTVLHDPSDLDQCDILLLDSIGELTAVFEHATAVFMGGTLVPRGGHNVLEPARFSRPVVFGAHMENFRDMARAFLEADAAIQVRDEVGLAGALDRLLRNPEAAARLGANARGVAEANAGATDRALEAIAASLGVRETSDAVTACAAE
jgi:3-deoxy-D-manno-octulosonic-acid transferase